jgi:ribosomal protein S18 acetylase RimI-like enzyme
MKVEIQGPLLNQSARCEPVLRSLKDWFDIEAENLHYLAAMQTLPTFIASADQRLIGFIVVKQHYAHAAEVYVLGVLPDYHRHGVGRALMAAAETYLHQKGVQYLQVKTLSDSHPDPGYARTRAFYLGIGFQPLEEFKTLWDEANPCLLMVKRIG